MEARILEIENKYIEVNGNDIKMNKVSCATEIASMVREFVEWEAWECDLDKDNSTKTWYRFGETELECEFTADELFDYWFLNVRNK